MSVWHNMRKKPAVDENGFSKLCLVETTHKGHRWRLCRYVEDHWTDYNSTRYSFPKGHKYHHLNDFTVRKWAYIMDLYNIDNNREQQ